MIHFNYQPLSWENEWKIFKFNLKQLWAKRNKRILENRINRETYKICFWLYWATAESIISFCLLFIYLPGINMKIVLSGMLVCESINFLFLLYALGKRLQDLYIPSIAVWMVFFFLMWYSGFLENPIFFSFDEPFELVRRHGGVSFLRFPEFITWMKVVTMIALMLPQNSKNNRYGKATNPGITFFEKNFPEWQGNANYIWQAETEEETYKRSCKYFFYATTRIFKGIFNFKSRISLDDFKGGIGGILIICQAIVALTIFNLPYTRINDFGIFCMIVHFVVLVPTLSAYVRRLHDGYNSALWIPLTYIPLINIFVYLMLLVTPSWKPEDIKLEE